VFYRLVITN